MQREVQGTCGGAEAGRRKHRKRDPDVTWDNAAQDERTDARKVRMSQQSADVGCARRSELPCEACAIVRGAALSHCVALDMGEVAAAG